MTTFSLNATISDIVRRDLPNFDFSHEKAGNGPFVLRFLVYGDRENRVRIQPRFLKSVSCDIKLKMTSPGNVSVEPGKLTLIIVPIACLTIPGIYLECKRESVPISIDRTCKQEAFDLDTKEPKICITGNLIIDEDDDAPYMVTQMTSPFKKRYGKVHVRENEVCMINSISTTTEHVVFPIECSRVQYKHMVNELNVSLTMMDTATIAFRKNPFWRCPWTKNMDKIPIIYTGSTVTVPPKSSISVNYNNVYSTAAHLNLIAMVLSVESYDNDIVVEDSVWRPGETLSLNVSNCSNFPVEVYSGQHMADAVLIHVTKYPMDSFIPRKILDRLATALTLPGNLLINAARQPTFSRIFDFMEPILTKK